MISKNEIKRIRSSGDVELTDKQLDDCASFLAYLAKYWDKIENIDKGTFVDVISWRKP